MTSSGSDIASPASSNPVRHFFAERLPAGPEGEGATEAEARVLLDLETSAPLPADKLTYGWVRLPSREILYYAAPRERLPEHAASAPAGTVLPETGAVLLPEGVSSEDFLRATRDHHADLRSRRVLAELRARAAADRLLSRLTWPLRAGAIIGLLLLFAAGALTTVSAYRETRLADDATTLKTIGGRADLLAALERLEGPGRSVFDALAVVNPHRPEGVAFTKVVLSDNRELGLEGRGPGVADINRMADALRRCGFFDAVDLTKVDASGGRSTFRMRLTVKTWPKIADAPTSLAETPSGAAAATSETEGASR